MSGSKARKAHQAKAAAARARIREEAGDRERLVQSARNRSALIAEQLSKALEWRNERVSLMQRSAEERLAHLGTDVDPEGAKTIRRELKEELWGANAVLAAVKEELKSLDTLLQESGVVSVKLIRAVDAWRIAQFDRFILELDILRGRKQLSDPGVDQALTDALRNAYVTRVEMYAADPVGLRAVRRAVSKPGWRETALAQHESALQEGYVDLLEAQMHWDLEEAEGH